MGDNHCLNVLLPGGLDALTSAEFSPNQYVNGLRKLVPLDKLCSSIAQEIEKAQETLMTVVNDRHSDVVKLSLDLRVATEHLPRIRAELASYASLCASLFQVAHTALQDIQQMVTAYNATFTQMSKEQILLMVYTTVQTDLQSIRVVKDMHQSDRSCLFLELVAEDIKSAERILGELDKKEPPTSASAAMGDSDTTAYRNVWDNILTILDELRGLVAECLSEALVSSLASLTTATGKSRESLNCPLPAGTTEWPEVYTSVSHSCFGLLSINQDERVRAIFRTVLVDPVIAKALKASFNGNAHQRPADVEDVARNASREDHTAMERFLSSIRQALDEELSPFVNLLQAWRTHIANLPPGQQLTHDQRMHKRLQELQLPQKCFIFPVIQELQSSFPSCFVPVFAEPFIANFLHAHQLVDHLITLLLTPPEQLQFLMEKDWIRFTTQWKTQAYEARRCRFYITELKQRLQKAGHSTVTDPTPKDAPVPPPQQYHFQATAHVVDLIRKALNHDELVQREFPKVMRLVAEMIVIHYGGVVKGLPVAKRQTSQESTGQAAFSDDTDLSSHDDSSWQRRTVYFVRDLLLLETELLCETAPGNSQPVTLLSMMLLESETHQKSCQSLAWPEDLITGAAGSPNNTTEQKRIHIKHFCAQLARALRSERQRLQKVLTQSVLETLQQTLQAMRGVPPLYRMTNREITGQPSAYVDAACKPLRILTALLEHNTTSATSWIEDMVDSVFQLYGQRLKEVFSTVQLQERSLRRLRRVKQPPRGPGLTSSENASDHQDEAPTALDRDRAKIIRQLEIDGKAFEASWIPYLNPCNMYASQPITTVTPTDQHPGYALFSTVMTELIQSLQTCTPLGDISTNAKLIPM